MKGLKRSRDVVDDDFDDAMGGVEVDAVDENGGVPLAEPVVAAAAATGKSEKKARKEV